MKLKQKARVAVDPANARFVTKRTGGQRGLDIDAFGVPIHALDEYDKPVCGAQLRKKKAGTLCQSHLRMSNGRCRLHGGKQPRGIDHHNWKTGKQSRYARVLAPEMGESLRLMREREDKLSHIDDIELTDVILEQLVVELQEDNAPSIVTIENFQRVHADMIAAFKGNPRDERRKLSMAIDEFEDILKAAIDYRGKRKDLFDAQKHRADLVEKENRTIDRRERQMTEKEALAIFARLTIAFRLRVLNERLWKKGPQAVLAALSNDVDNIMSGYDVALPPGSDPDLEIIDTEMVVDGEDIEKVYAAVERELGDPADS